MGHLDSHRRAVRDNQKEERRQDILEMAWRLFQNTSYEELTIADVAAALGLAKGTVYLYFKTKEDLFLAIQEQQLIEWFAEVDDQLRKLRSSCTIPQVVDVLCAALDGRSGFMRLLAILHTIIERNIDSATALNFKRMLLRHFTRTGSLLEECLPFLLPGEGSHFLLQAYALVIGFWHLSDPAPVIRQVLQHPELHVFEVHFAPEFSSTLRTLLYGLERGAQAISKEEDIL